MVWPYLRRLSCIQKLFLGKEREVCTHPHIRGLLGEGFQCTNIRCHSSMLVVVWCSYNSVWIVTSKASLALKEHLLAAILAIIIINKCSRREVLGMARCTTEKRRKIRPELGKFRMDDFTRRSSREENPLLLQCYVLKLRGKSLNWGRTPG